MPALRVLAVVLATIAGGVAGLILGFLAGLAVWCEWLYPASNTCGLAAVFFAAPLGAAPGALIAFLIARRFMLSRGPRA